MILYLDASALVKLYGNEEYSDVVRGAVEQSRALCCHLITYAEVRAGLVKAKRMRRLADDEYAYNVQRFEHDWSSIQSIGVDIALIRRAGEIAEDRNLRGYDSVHLAAAERAFEAAGRPETFVLSAFDSELLAAAQALGINVLN